MEGRGTEDGLGRGGEEGGRKGRWGRRQGQWWYGGQGSEDASEGRDGERWEGRVKEFRRWRSRQEGRGTADENKGGGAERKDKAVQNAGSKLAESRRKRQGECSREKREGGQSQAMNEARRVSFRRQKVIRDAQKKGFNAPPGVNK